MQPPKFGEADAALSIAAVSQRTGIPKATLRVWDSRYGLSPHRTTTGGHRRYSPADVELLLTVRRLTARGVPAGEAARAVLAGREVTAALPLPPGSSAAAGRLAAAAMQLDGPACASLLREHLREAGVVTTWETVLRPVLNAVGGLAEGATLGIAVEHVVSHVATVALGEICTDGTARRGTGRGAAAILLACTPEESHELPMTALAAALTDQGRPATLVGARTPVRALVEAVQRQRPPAVVLFCLLHRAADPAAVGVLCSRTPVLAAGPGWSRTRLPMGVRRVNGLSDATAALGNLGG